MHWSRAVPVCLIAASIWSAPVQGGADPKDIIVEGAREQRTMQGGEWLISMSRSYRFGKSIELGETMTSIGKDREWRFCLADTQVEDFVRLLVGQGRSQVAGTTLCRPVQMRLGKGRLRATQTCQGGYVTQVDARTRGLTSAQTRLVTYVTGDYGATALKLDFENRRELFAPVPNIMPSDGPTATGSGAPSSVPDIMHWSVSGKRTGDCEPDKAP